MGQNNLEQVAPMYAWKGQPEGFQVLLEKVKQLGICDDKKEFQNLFEYDDRSNKIILNSSRPDYVLQFFVCLKESGFVGSIGGKGFYGVPKERVFEFSQIFLKNRTPQRRVDTVKNLLS